MSDNSCAQRFALLMTTNYLRMKKNTKKNVTSIIIYLFECVFIFSEKAVVYGCFTTD